MQKKINLGSMLIIIACVFAFVYPVDAATLANVTVRTIVPQSDGKMIIGGDFSTYNGIARNRIARINVDGTLDTDFVVGTGIVGYVFDSIVQSDGKIVLGGMFTSYNGTARNRIVRLNTDGSLDTSFSYTTGFNDTVRSMAVLPNDKILVSGQFTSYNGTAKNYFVRLNADGTFDSTFNPAGAGPNGYCEDIEIQSDGKILIAGNFLAYNGVSRYYLARLNSDGTLDTDFVVGTGANQVINDIDIQADGKIIIGGNFTTYNGTSRVYLARINSDGSLDNTITYSVGYAASNSVQRVDLQPDGKILVGGQFTLYGGVTRNNITRVNSDGTLDTDFNVGTGANSTMWTSFIQPDGKIVIGGSFTTYSGITSNYIARLSSSGAIETGFGDPLPVSAPSLTTNITTDITQTTASGNGTIDAIGGENPTRYIEWGTTSGVYTHSCTAGTGDVGVYTCAITGLTPDTTYYYRAKATNAGGTSYGNEMSFVTLASAIIIPDPDSTKIEDAVNDGYIATDNNADLMQVTQVITQVNVTMRSAGADVVFPTGTQITKNGGGIFDFSAFTTENVTNSVQIQEPTSLAAVKVGTTGASFSFTQPVAISLYVGTSFDGQELDILYQNDGDPTWYTHTTPTCTVTGGYCTFQTNHATIYTINGIHQATGDTPLNINTNVQATLSVDCYDPTDSNTTVQLGTTTTPGTVTAGTPAVGTSRCDVTTNDDQGYYLTLTDTNATYTTLTHTDPNTSTIYEISDDTLNTYTGLSTTLQTWNAPTTKGLGFSVIHFPETNTSHNTFNNFWTETNQCPEGTNPDTNTYAAIPQTPQPIAAVTAYHANTTTTDLCYKVDVPASQPSGQYTGTITFTATSDASGYYQ